MDEIYVTYVDDEHVDNHDYDDNTDDDHDNNNDLYDRACNARVNTSIYIYIYINRYF